MKICETQENLVLFCYPKRRINFQIFRKHVCSKHILTKENTFKQRKSQQNKSNFHFRRPVIFYLLQDGVERVLWV
jgi:hypothetical protein